MAIELDDRALVGIDLARSYIHDDSFNVDTELLSLMVNAATRVLERITDRQLAATEYTDARPHFDPSGSRWMFAPEWPINTISRIREFGTDLENPTTIDADDYAFLPHEPYKILLKHGLWVSGYRYAIDFNGGYGYDADATDNDGSAANSFNRELVPDDLVELVCEVMAAMWKKQDARAFITETRSIQSASMTIREEALPPRAKTILSTYQRPQVFAG